LIHRLFHLEHKGYYKIVQQLMEKKMLAPFGGVAGWNVTTVRKILEQPLYGGMEIRHRWTKALYHTLGKDGPLPVDVDQDELQREGRVSVPATERHRDDWMLVDIPWLRDFLPPDVRPAAIEFL
jgi:hypothetical protein